MRLALVKVREWKTGCRLRMATFWVLAVLCTLIAVMMLRISRWHNPVAQAEAALQKAKAKLEFTRRVASRANAIAEGIHPKLAPMVESTAQPLIKELGRNVIKAAVDVSVQHTVVAADFCVKTYPDIGAAQEATAALSLADVTWRIRSAGRTNLSQGHAVYEVMVPNDLAPAALLALQNVSILPLRSFSHPLDAMRTVEKLKKQRIPATTRPLRGTYQVYVKGEDHEAATQLLDVR